MASNSALAFFLDAPMQSWGASSRFQHRKTESYPTKSGVLGLVAAALGIDKNSPEEASALAPLAVLEFSAFALVHSEHPCKVVRLVDFHTVGGGYPDTPIGKMSIPPIAERSNSGKLQWRSSDKRTVPTHRTYLTSARFIVTLEGHGETLNRIANALQNPVWGVWFGRKTCLPASPLLPTLGENRQAAMDDLLKAVNQVFPVAVASGQEQVAADGSWFQSDEPISFGQRHFCSRPVRRTTPGT